MYQRGIERNVRFSFVAYSEIFHSLLMSVIITLQRYFKLV